MHSNEKATNEITPSSRANQLPHYVPLLSREEHLLRLQRTAGNQAVSTLIETNRATGATIQRNVATGTEQSQLEELEIVSDSGMTAAQKKKSQASARRDQMYPGNRKVTIVNPNYVGSYEHAGADHPVPTIQVGSEARVRGGGRLGKLQTEYDTYTPSLRATLKAMGRLKDLDNAGAKIDPAALKSDPKLAARFGGRAGDHSKEFHTWSALATDQGDTVKDMQVGFEHLKAALFGFRAAQNLLEQRQKRGQLEEAKSKKKEIDETMETLVSIIETCRKAYDWSEALEGAALANEAVDASGIKQEVKQELLLFATGKSKEYKRLTKQIEALQKNLVALKFKEESDRINESFTELGAMQKEVQNRVGHASHKGGQARAAAGDFGTAMAGEDGALAMFAAQAYQDLAFHGSSADDQRRGRIDPHLTWLFGFLEHDRKRAEAERWTEDWSILVEWGQQMVEQRNFFSERTPEWNKKAAAWNEFFVELTGGPLALK
jgi:hypothetical protein